MNFQNILHADNASYKEFDDFLRKSRIQKIFLVCGNSSKQLDIGKHIRNLPSKLGIGVEYFSEYTPNPDLNSVMRGIEQFKKSDADLIVALGGGSAIDVAKCIKIWPYFYSEKQINNDLPLLAIPTTAGTGSESTHFAVIYKNGVKQSIEDENILPTAVLFDPGALVTLPIYQRKSTMLDALSHSLESYWSVNSTGLSRGYSSEAIRAIFSNAGSYVKNEDIGNRNMLMAANMAGKAINITKTTAGHAMSYKLTGLYGISHGHAAGLVNTVLFPWMIKNMDKCCDSRGKMFLENIFYKIAKDMGCDTPKDAAEKLKRFYKSLLLDKPQILERDFKILKESVNNDRLSNTPVFMSDEDIDMIYHELL